MTPLVLSISIVFQVNLFPPIMSKQDFLSAPKPPKVCMSLGINRMQGLANGAILLGGGASGGALMGFIGGHLDPVAEQSKTLSLVGVVEGSVAKTFLDIMPLGLRTPC